MVNMLNSQGPIFTDVGLVVENIRSFVSHLGFSFKFVFIPREINGAAHHLTRFASSIEDSES